MLIIVLLALSLSIDALGIGLSYGFRNISTPLFTKCIIALESMISLLPKFSPFFHRIITESLFL